MTLIRATNASETMGRVSMLIAAYCQRTGMPMDTLASYLQIRQPPVPGTIPAGAGSSRPAGASPPADWDHPRASREQTGLVPS
ncbi:hypothetical protein OG814_40315 [Streptomyces zaomyceticus]|uniref:Uncharacterized protein n=1 Tax=Streptomyces zaomyceticus TaxID=68286 RepID=A0ABZ1LMW8_9ACTN